MTPLANHCLVKYESVNNVIVWKIHYCQLKILCKSDLRIPTLNKLGNSPLLNLEKLQYLPHYWSKKAYKSDTVMNRASATLSEGSLEITIPLPLKQKVLDNLNFFYGLIYLSILIYCVFLISIFFIYWVYFISIFLYTVFLKSLYSLILV